jgi:hypothetical protein
MGTAVGVVWLPGSGICQGWRREEGEEVKDRKQHHSRGMLLQSLRVKKERQWFR